MRFILALLLVLSVPSYAQSETFEVELPILCSSTENFATRIQEEYGERIFMISGDVNERNEQLYHSFWVNRETKTWTFMVTNDARGITCILASGDDFSLVSQGIGA